MKIQEIDNNMCVVLEDTGDIARMIMCMREWNSVCNNCYMNNAIPYKLIERLEDELQT